MTKEILLRLEQIDRRLEAFERKDETCFVDHKGLSVVASEGLRGGGTIDRSRPLALDVGGLEVGELKPSSWSLVYDDQEHQHFQVPFWKFLEGIKKASGFEELQEAASCLIFRMDKLEKDFGELGLYDALPNREALLLRQEREAKELSEWIEKIAADIKKGLSDAKSDLTKRVDGLEQRENAVRDAEQRNAGAVERVEQSFREIEDAWNGIESERRRLAKGLGEVATKERQIERISSLESLEVTLERKEKALERANIQIEDQKKELALARGRVQELESELKEKIRKIREIFQ